MNYKSPTVFASFKEKIKYLEALKSFIKASLPNNYLTPRSIVTKLKHCKILQNKQVDDFTVVFNGNNAKTDRFNCGDSAFYPFVS